MRAVDKVLNGEGQQKKFVGRISRRRNPPLRGAKNGGLRYANPPYVLQCDEGYHTSRLSEIGDIVDASAT
jgi:hypothetical protein